MRIADFVTLPARYELSQQKALEWMAAAHAESEATLGGLDLLAKRAFETKMLRVLSKVACTPDKIAQRGHHVDHVARGAFDPMPRGAGTFARMKTYATIVDDAFMRLYSETAPPDDIIHVTCTGYVSPSGAQKLVAAKKWPTRVTHAYHMGCYAAIPALRIAAGAGGKRVDLVHTELCSLHMDAADHSPEQLVVQSLFADGLIRYSLVNEGPGLELLTTHERVLPDSAHAMSWRVGDHGMAMTLARDVPARIGVVLRDFVSELFARAKLPLSDLKRCAWAVHPGGPKILDGVRDTLELGESQIATSRAVLREHGNMSSATLPYIWMRLLRDVPNGTLIPSLAFGPGLTICGALLEKRC
ncbi:MAG TPA: 3-oxoacyl-[acyl-carrier-protein] synthase III C-terminal domain-containing protein [Kofleriaceae bacterium]|nr:3-oxoacyl-[acyl-carrier-protein] synthase III C-terminal domain-containing protein [Kofleriaceae bacterium]